MLNLRNYPQSMKLPKYPCLSTMIKIQEIATKKLKLDSSGRAKFNGTDDELQRTVTVLDQAPKFMNPPMADRWQINSLGSCG